MLERKRDNPEAREQRDGVKLLQTIGARVYVSGTKRKQGDYQGSMQTPGIPDVEAFLPMRQSLVPYGQSRRILKWEVKAPITGRLSLAQKEYASMCKESGVDHIAGPCSSLVEYLRQGGWLKV